MLLLQCIRSIIQAGNVVIAAPWACTSHTTAEGIDGTFVENDHSSFTRETYFGDWPCKLGVSLVERL